MDTTNKDSLIALRAELVEQQQELSRECRAPTRSMLLHLEHQIAALSQDLKALEEPRVPPSKSPLPPQQPPSSCPTPSSIPSVHAQIFSSKNAEVSMPSNGLPQLPLDALQGVSSEAASSQRTATADSEGSTRSLHSSNHVNAHCAKIPSTSMSSMPAAVLGDVFIFLLPFEVVTSVCAVDKSIGSACRERGLWRSFTQLAIAKAQAKLLSLDAARVLMLAEELGGARSRPPLEFFFTQIYALPGLISAVAAGRSHHYHHDDGRSGGEGGGGVGGSGGGYLAVEDQLVRDASPPPPMSGRGRMLTREDTNANNNDVDGANDALTDDEGADENFDHNALPVSDDENDVEGEVEDDSVSEGNPRAAAEDVPLEAGDVHDHRAGATRGFDSRDGGRRHRRGHGGSSSGRITGRTGGHRAAAAKKKLCVLALDKRCYNVTPFLADHPGGKSNLWRYNGHDATQVFDIYGHSEWAHAFMRRHLMVLDAVAFVGGHGGAPACTTKLFRQWRASGGTFAHGQRPPPPGARAYVSWRTRLSLSRWQRAASVKWAQGARALAGGVPWDEPWHMWEASTAPRSQPQPQTSSSQRSQHHGHHDSSSGSSGSGEGGDEMAKLRATGLDEDDYNENAKKKACTSNGKGQAGVPWGALTTIGVAVAVASLLT